MSDITPKLVARIAELAQLEFTEAELQEFTGRFGQILDYFEALKDVDTEGVPPLFHALQDRPDETPWRNDEVKPSLSREEVLSQAPETDGEHFVVPKVIE